MTEAELIEIERAADACDVEAERLWEKLNSDDEDRGLGQAEYFKRSKPIEAIERCAAGARRLCAEMRKQ